MAAAWSVTSVLAFLLNVTDGVPVSGMTARFVCLVTESGGAHWVAIPLIGFLLILLVDPAVAWRLGRLQVGKLLLVLSVTLPLSALVNERIVKQAFQIPRPSHRVLAAAQFIPDPGSFYALSSEAKEAVLAPLKDPRQARNTARQLQIDPRVLTQWAREVSSSFPSGHALNAFLAATLFVLVAVDRRTRAGSVVSVVILAWAIAVTSSRVLLGVHRPMDVSIGAALGIVLGLSVGWVLLGPDPQQPVDP